MLIFVISQNQAVVKAIKRYFKYVEYYEIQEIIAPPKIESITQLFLNILNLIQGNSTPERAKTLREAIAIVDLFGFNTSTTPNLSELNPISRDWQAVVAMLVLTFPEIHWVFLTSETEKLDFFLKNAHTINITNWSGKLKKIMEYRQANYTPLFDPAGLRNLIRLKIKNLLGKEQQSYAEALRLRKYIAAAIDEEPASAFMHAYLAYRFGFRTIAVTTEEMMKKIFENSSISVKLLLEDLFLNFPDRTIEKRLSILKERDEKFPQLKNACYRFLITVGHKHTLTSKNWRENKEYLKEQNQSFRFVFKPIAGIFTLKDQLKLDKIKINGEKYVCQFAKIPKFKKTKIIAREIAAGSHSSPGRLLLIAEHLTRRAEILLNNAITVEDAIQGAVLALEAKELLAYHTPTTSLEALSLQHQLEVIAECMFYGVEYHFNVKDRLKEIETEVHAIGQWFNPENRQNSELNARLSIAANLVRWFRHFNQFDEETECLQEVRHLHFKLYFRKNPWRYSVYPVIIYIEKMMNSVFLFATFLLFWPFLFGFLYWSFGNCFEESSCFWQNVIHSYHTFFGLQPIDFPIGGLCGFISVVEIIWGFIHLGIFISYIFQLIMRK